MGMTPNAAREMMKVGSKLQFSVPDKCPEECRYIDDIMNYGQSAICRYCPVLCCNGPEPMIEPEGMRDDWAEDWQDFFSGKVSQPELKIIIHHEN